MLSLLKCLPGFVNFSIVALAVDFNVRAVLLQPQLGPDLNEALLGHIIFGQLHGELFQISSDELSGYLQHFGNATERDICI